MKNEQLVKKLADYIENNPGYIGEERLDCITTARLKGVTVQKVQNLFLVKGALVSPSWTTGGMTGGSCYDSRGADSAVRPEMRPTWLEDILEETVPGITFLQYRKLDRLRKSFEYGTDCYYGNYTDHAFEVITLSDIKATLSP